MIHEFLAVTKTSVYHVKDGIDGEGNYHGPMAQKIALKSPSNIPVGDFLRNGTMLAICHQLIMYVPEGGGITSFQRKIEEVNTCWWGSNSSSIVALFLVDEIEERKARDCFQHHDLQPCDSRWLEDTQKVLDAIGDEHPVFYICRYPDLCLPIFEKQTA
jgi:hypothetical protein